MEDEARVAVRPLTHVRMLADADVAVPRECLQAVAITGPKNDLNSLSHTPASHVSTARIAPGEMLDLVY